MQEQDRQLSNIQVKLSENSLNSMKRQINISNIIFNEFKSSLRLNFNDQSSKREIDLPYIRFNSEQGQQDQMDHQFFDESSSEHEKQEVKQKGDTTTYNDLVNQRETQKSNNSAKQSQIHKIQIEDETSRIAEMLIAKISKNTDAKAKQGKQNNKDKKSNKIKVQQKPSSENKRTVINQKLLCDIKRIFDIMKTHDLNAKQIRQVFQQIVNTCGFSIKKVVELWKQYKFDPNLNNSFHKVKIRYNNYSQRKEFDITKKRIQFIKSFLTEHPLSTTKQICQAVEKQKDLLRGKQSVPPRTVRRLLKMISWQPKGSARTYSKINRQQAIQYRYNYAKKYCQSKNLGGKMLFVFQLQFPLFKKKQSNEEYPHIMVALDREHIFGFQLLGGSFKREDHMNFLEKIYSKVEKKLKEQRCYLMIDNPRIQDYSFAQLSQKFKTNIQIVRIPAGITTLNPGASFLLKLKNSLLSECEPKDIQTLGKMIKKIKSEVTAQFLEPHYEKVQTFIEKALKKEPF